METLSSSVSTLKVPNLLTHFKTTPSKNLLYSKPNNSNSLPTNKATTTYTTQNPFIPTTTFYSSTSPTPSFAASSPSLIRHHKPATGYAAALLDIAQANNSVDLVSQDVERLLKLMRNKRVQAVLGSPFVGDKEKSQVVKDLAEKGGFSSRHLVRLVRMLVEKNKDVGVIKQVLEEFERVYNEMLGTQVVLISSAKKIEEDQMFGIAKRVQRLTGAFKVKVKNLVRQNSFSFAV